jgi:acetyl-CoA carboxylase biotin carboxyl carrier protein
LKKSTNKKSKTASSNSPAKTRGGDAFSLELVKSFTEFMRSNDLVELDMRSGDSQIRLRRGEVAASYAVPVAQAPASAATSSAAPIAAPAAVEAPSRKYHVVTSPFVGTFYRAAGPNQDSFVDEGQTVAVGDTLCIVEAMKLMNEIESDAKGRIVKILVGNGTPVEFGEPLFEIDPL